MPSGSCKLVPTELLSQILILSPHSSLSVGIQLCVRLQYSISFLFFFFEVGEYGQNSHIPLFSKIFSNILQFVKYLAIYHFFET